jgi:hypothetical protein
MAGAYGVYFNDAAIDELLNGDDGPVWQLVNELSEQAARTARALVPIRPIGSTWSARSTAQPRGFTLASIRAKMGYNDHGRIWGGVNAAELPTIWLEYPRVDRRRQPFLTEAVWSLEGLF